VNLLDAAVGCWCTVQAGQDGHLLQSFKGTHHHLLLPCSQARTLATCELSIHNTIAFCGTLPGCTRVPATTSLAASCYASWYANLTSADQ
jgi:hypothetical protein